VTATTAHSGERKFYLDAGTIRYMYGGFADARSLTVYVESASTRQGQSDVISASFTGASGAYAGAAVGTLDGNDLKLVFLRNQVVTDTVDVFSAQLRGDSLVGTFSKGAPAKYV